MSAIIIEEKDSNLLIKKLFSIILERYCGVDLESNHELVAKILELRHPDIKIVLKSDGKNTIGIDQIKEITKFTSFYPYEAEFKSIIIPNANQMTPEAQNALLKTLEDHSTTTFFLLGTNSRKNLLPTVNSRCSLLTFKESQITVPDTFKLDTDEVADKSEQTLNNLTLEETDKIFAAKDINKRDIAIELLRNTLVEEREKLNHFIMTQKSSPMENSLDKVKLLQKLIGMVERNTNPKLVVERYIIQYL